MRVRYWRAQAEELLSLRRGHIIEKVRYIVPCGSLNWEVDVFSGDNRGLVMAEIELLRDPLPRESP
jgi:adenylate cyclase